MRKVGSDSVHLSSHSHHWSVSRFPCAGTSLPIRIAIYILFRMSWSLLVNSEYIMNYGSDATVLLMELGQHHDRSTEAAMVLRPFALDADLRRSKMM